MTNAEIITEMEAVDAQSIRALRAILLIKLAGGVPDKLDVDQLTQHERAIAILRSQLNG